MKGEVGSIVLNVIVPFLGVYVVETLAGDDESLMETTPTMGAPVAAMPLIVLAATGGAPLPGAEEPLPPPPQPENANTSSARKRNRVVGN